MSTTLAIVSAVCLGIEMLISFPRHTTRAATVDKNLSDLFELRVEAISSSSNGMAYWVQGRPVPVLEATGREDVLLTSQLHDIVDTVPVIVEGPFGPNIGIASWLYDRLIKEQKREYPVQVPVGEKLCFVTDSTGLARGVSLWARQKSSVPLLIASTASEMLKKHLDSYEMSDGTTAPQTLEELVRHYSGKTSLVVICGKPKFQSQVEDWVASYRTVNR